MLVPSFSLTSRVAACGFRIGPRSSLRMRSFQGRDSGSGQEEETEESAGPVEVEKEMEMEMAMTEAPGFVYLLVDDIHILVRQHSVDPLFS